MVEDRISLNIQRQVNAAINDCGEFLPYRQYKQPLKIENGTDVFFCTISALLAKEGKKVDYRPYLMDVAEWLNGNVRDRAAEDTFEHTNGYKKDIFTPLTSARGILLMGGTGTGKSYITNYVLPTIFRMKNPNNIYKAVPMYRFANEFDSLMKKSIIILDDVGTESKKSDYGVKRDLFVEFIAEAYDQNKMLIISTNLSGNDILNEYGERTKSRLDEMVVPIFCTGCDFRTKR